MEISDLQARAMQVRALFAEYEKEHNKTEWTNRDILIGFVGDVGDLAKLVMAKEGHRKIDDVDEKLAHELADCLWSILVLAKKFDIDLEKGFLNTMDEIEADLKASLDVSGAKTPAD